MLRRFIPAFVSIAALFAVAASAADGESGAVDMVAAWEADPTHVFDAGEIDLDAFQWRARPVVVFANSPFDPAYAEQMEELQSEIERLVARDVVLIADTDPDSRSEPRLRLRPRGFMLVLIGKDGQVELRKPQPRTARELSRTIDKMPLRRQEMRDGF